jgi:hypothetical protein
MVAVEKKKSVPLPGSIDVDSFLHVSPLGSIIMTSYGTANSFLKMKRSGTKQEGPPCRIFT